MPDPYLEAMMSGRDVKSKKQTVATEPQDRFTLAIEKNIDDYLDTVDFKQNENQLLSVQLQRQKLKEELHETLKMGELNQDIEKAIKILLNDGMQVLDKAEYENLIKELSQMSAKLNVLDLTSLPEENFKTFLNFSDQMMRSILKVAVSKFSLGEYENAFSVFMLLITLNPGNPEYWFRSGMAAHQNDQIDLALCSYQAAVELDPDLVGAFLFMAECYLRQGKQAEAKEAYQRAKAIETSNGIESDWKELLLSMDAALK
ncbi:MAG: tetratricopeptide repeat protein [Parachlamydiaceae bacterium]